MRSGRRAAVLLAAVALLTLAACGGPAPTALPTPPLNGEQLKQPSQIYQDARTAFSGVHSLRMDVDLVSPQGEARFTLDVDTTQHVAHLTGSDGGGHFEMSLVGGVVYLDADTGFYNQIGQSDLGQLAGQWVIPPGSYPLVIAVQQYADAKQLPGCLFGGATGTLAAGGTTSVLGEPAIVVHDSGDKPGTTPTDVAVSLVGTPYPVLVTILGPQQAGAQPSACALAGSQVTHGSAQLSRFNLGVTVTPPPNPVDIRVLGGG